MWKRIASWFTANAEHCTRQFLPEPGAQPIRADQGYVRLWLSEGFLAKRRTWGNDHAAVMHGGLSLRLLGRPGIAFTTVASLPDQPARAGEYLDYDVTPLLPFTGGVVEIESALYRTSADGLLAGAAAIAGGLKPLLGPPLSTAIEMAEKVSESVAHLLTATDERPLLGIHWSPQSGEGGGAGSAGGSGARGGVTPGHLVLIDTPPGTIQGSLAIEGGRLVVQGNAGPERLVGYNYLVLRLECTTTREEWRQPELQALIDAARQAVIYGELDTYRRLRREAVVRAATCPDFIPADQKRVAVLVGEMVEEAAQLGASADPQTSLAAAAAERLPDAQDPRVLYFDLDELIKYEE